MKTKLFLCLLLMMALLALLGSCGPKPDNLPYEPDTSPPPPLNGVFAAEGSAMTFNGDSATVVLDLAEDFAARAGLPAGHSEGTYAFTQNLPPHGHVPVRYDAAHTLVITLGEGDAQTEVVLDIGYAAEDGASASVYIGAVTEDRIPILLTDKGFETVLFQRTVGAG